MRLKLAAKPPFSLFSTVKSHGWHQLAPFSFDSEAVRLTYVFQLSSGRVVELTFREKEGGVRIESHASMNTQEKREVKQSTKWMLGLDQDFSAFYSLARKEPKLAKMEEKAQGRVLRSPTLYEDVTKTILTTNTLWAATIRMTNNLVTQFGKPLPDNPSKQAFPTPERLAETNEKTLRAETRLGYRAPYILKLAQNVASGELNLETLKTSDLPTVQLRKELLSIKGVGNYAAANLLMLLGRYDFIPIDSWAMKVVSHEWYNGESIGADEIETAFAKWGEWKGFAYWFWNWSYFEIGK
ncbi:MAG: DNA-3-methyladenine glycosylase family protein [Candidatus Thorarchaeota archaeon]|jgi:3-methyladenine DNA glycosylase/8-oxoguanine DNA glycosylase